MQKYFTYYRKKSNHYSNGRWHVFLTGFVTEALKYSRYQGIRLKPSICRVEIPFPCFRFLKRRTEEDYPICKIEHEYHCAEYRFDYDQLKRSILEISRIRASSITLCLTPIARPYISNGYRSVLGRWFKKIRFGSDVREYRHNVSRLAIIIHIHYGLSDISQKGSSIKLQITKS